MVTSYAPNQNHLLAALPAAEFNRLAPHLELVQMPLDEVYCESGFKLQYVYFPTTAIVSLRHVRENGTPAEIAAMGNEGMLGISLFNGCNATPNRAFVRSEGYGYKLKAQLLMEEFNRAGAMQRLLLRYTEALLTQTYQTVICNRRYSVEQRLCRWLLLTLDRMPSNELTLTQELLVGMLGESRRAIMEAAGKLQQAGFISCRHDSITVLDRSGLEGRARECYSVLKREYDRLLGPDWDSEPIPAAFADADARTIARTWFRESQNGCLPM